MRAKAPALRFHPLTPARWPDFESLFGPRGACAGCWYMWPRTTRAEFARGKGAGNRRALKRLVARGSVPGLIATVGGEPAGWCALGPRSVYSRLARSRVLEPVDERPVWSILCFFVARPFRRQGMTVKLLREAWRYAARGGAEILEGYPVEPGSGKTADAFAWTGLASAFRRAGFREATRRSPTRPMMRRALRRRRGPAT